MLCRLDLLKFTDDSRNRDAKLGIRLASTRRAAEWLPIDLTLLCRVVKAPPTGEVILLTPRVSS